MSDSDDVHADRSFIVFVCRGCHADCGVYAIKWLRTTVTCSAALVLAESQCVMGPLMCRGLGERLGMMTAVQPCTRHGTPTGRPRIVGPITSIDDVDQYCRWLDGIQRRPDAWHTGP